MGYDDGKAPKHRLDRKDISHGPGGKSEVVIPHEGSPVQARDPRPYDVEPPRPRGNGLFKAKGCIPHKGAV